MPIATHQPGSRPTTVRRSGVGASTGGSAPPGDLLPSGGAHTQGRAPAPRRALALDALLILRTLRDRPRGAGLWGEPAFAREVDLSRRQLAPIVSRRGLAASFAREAFQTPDRPGRSESDAFRPIRIAYAVRWLELGDGRARPAWSQLVTDRA